MQTNFLSISCNDIGNLTFNDLWLEYYDFLQIKYKYQTFSKIEERVKNHILPFFKDYFVINIKHYDVINWMKYIDSNNYSYNYCSSLFSALSDILGYAVSFYGLNENIAKKVGNFPKKKPKKEISFWTFEEYNKFISCIPDRLYKTFFETLYSTGMRQGECIALKWNDFKEDFIEVNKTISKTKYNGEYVINSPKTASSCRIIYIDEKLKKSLNDLLEQEKNKENFNSNWFIFGGNKPLSATTILRKKNYYCEISNVKKIRIHEFRHSHATLLLSKGIPITVISQRLGHSNIEMTLNTYSHLIKEDEKKATMLLNELKTSLN